jgi:hypothetical protein
VEAKTKNKSVWEYIKLNYIRKYTEKKANSSSNKYCNYLFMSKGKKTDCTDFFERKHLVKQKKTEAVI